MSQFLDGKVTLYAGDCLDVLATLPENSVDSVVCDPPYHLTSIVKRFGNSDPEDVEKNATARKIAGQGTSPHGRAAAGFMGKQWDGGDIAFQPSTWAAVLRVLKPGGYIVAFASSRGFGRMSVAIEDAGFINHPMFGWIFGSGFPKATRIKAEGYEGFRYGGQATKPALEPVYMGQKPFSEATGTANILRWGTGALNIDGCRVDGTPAEWGNMTEGNGGYRLHKRSRDGEASAGKRYAEQGATDFAATPGPRGGDAKGRWPANIIHDGSDEVLAAFPEAGGSSSGGLATPKKIGASIPLGGDRSTVFHNDSGSAARFFYQVEKEARCDLCFALLTPENGRVDACDAPTAIPSSSTKNTLSVATARSGVAGLRLRESEGSQALSNGHASSVANPSGQCLPQIDGSVPPSAETWPLERIAQNVRSAADLCHSCETDIARALVAVRRNGQQALSPSIFSIGGSSAITLSRCLANYVAHRESTDTILTIQSLSGLFGSVFHAIDASTSSASQEPDGKSAPRRLFYSAKADADDRIGSKHPTVKPLDLMQYLVRLVTPPGGLVLDPFAGTGTTGEAAWREGMRAVLIEREPEYQADIARRMDLAENPTKRAAVAKSKNNLQGAEGTPLFGTDAA